MDIARSFSTDLETSFTTEMKLELGTEYTFTVRAYTSEGPGESTSTVVTTLERLCEMKCPLYMFFHYIICPYPIQLQYKE